MNDLHIGGLRKTAIVVRRSAVVGVQDMRAFFTWRSWLFGWVLRVVFQVLFFTLVGRYLGSPAATRYLLVGSAAVIVVLETMTVVTATAVDRFFGILPLLVASPGDYHLVYLARNVNTIVTGVTTSTISLLAGALVVGVDLSLPRVLLAVLLLAVGAVTTYLFGGCLGALVAKAARARWAAFNVGYLSLMACCGFVVPSGFWPLPVRVLAEGLPFTHVLRAIRGTLDGRPAGMVLGQLGLELVVGVGWFVAGRFAFRATVRLARRDGTIDLAG